MSDARSPDGLPANKLRPADLLKRAAAAAAVEWIKPGMRIGLGSGSTAWWLLELIATRIADGSLSDLICVATSAAVEREARRINIPLASAEDPPQLDLTIDGADELDPRLEMIKGGGGALLREKLVAQLSQRELIIVDESKLSPRLGTRHSLPIEVVDFAWKAQRRYLESLGARAVLRVDAQGQPFRTDQGHLILDCDFGPIEHPYQLADQLASRAGVVAHGLFLHLATDALVASPAGVRHLTRP